MKFVRALAALVAVLILILVFVIDRPRAKLTNTSDPNQYQILLYINGKPVSPKETIYMVDGLDVSVSPSGIVRVLRGNKNRIRAALKSNPTEENTGTVVLDYKPDVSKAHEVGQRS